MAAPSTVQFAAVARAVANMARLANPFVIGSSAESDGIAAIGQIASRREVSITYVISTSPPSWRTNIHFHMLVLDGAYLVDTEPPVFRRVAPPRLAELQALVERLAARIGRALERQGVLARDAESSYLDLGSDAGGPMDDLLGHSITYWVAVGPRAGQTKRADAAQRATPKAAPAP